MLLVEEQSMEAFLGSLLPRLLPADRTYEVHAFQDKSDLLRSLPMRLRGYRRWLPPDWRLVVLIDRDSDDCRELKERLENIAGESGMTTRTSAGGAWQVANRVVIEELEAWYFGDWEAVCDAYPRLPATVDQKARFRIPDAIRGGTWEALERIMQQHGYFNTGLRKVEAARAVGKHIDAERNRSRSFARFRDVVTEPIACPP